MNKWLLTILSFALVLVSHVSKAQKTDTIIFYNGDRAICEIKYMFQGKLKISTVAMGTISVEWQNIKYISSRQTFEIVLNDHTTFFGRIDGVDSLGDATVFFGIFSQTVPLEEIVELTPIKDSFLQRIDGSVSFGLTYTKGTENVQLNSSGDINYRTNRTLNTVSFNSNISGNRVGTSEKQDAGYRFQYTYKRRIFNAYALRWEQNTELGIASRIITTITTGYSPVENSANVLSLELGASANREFTTEDSALNNVEALLRIKYSLFIFSSPKIFIDIESTNYPSLTVRDRFRSNLDLKIKWEIFNDFTFNFTFWGNYDSKPVQESALEFDFGTTTSIGYTF